MLTPQRLRRRSGIRKPSAEAMVVLDIGEDVTSVWSPGTGIRSEPSRVALGTGGRVRDFGFAADLLGGSSLLGEATAHPDPYRRREQVATEFLAWVFERAGIRAIQGSPVFLSIYDSSMRGERNLWCEAILQMGGDPLLVHRPLAARVSLGIPDDGPRSHLLAEVSESNIHLAVIHSSSVHVSRRMPRHAHVRIRDFTDQCLRSLDPDDELEIRDTGVYLYGWSAARHAGETLRAIDLPLAAPVSLGPTVLDGVRVIAEEVLPCLVTEN